MQVKNVSFGAMAAIVTSIGLIIGLDAATANKATILSGLFIVAMSDNLTDSLSVHIYQESERLEPRAAFHATLTNIGVGARLGLSLSFVFVMVILPLRVAVVVSVMWGLALLTGYKKTTSALIRRSGVRTGLFIDYSMRPDECIDVPGIAHARRR